MSKVVVDASFALKWVLPETDSSVAIVLLNKWMTEHTGVLAPALFAYEVTNIIYLAIITPDPSRHSVAARPSTSPHRSAVDRSRAALSLPRPVEWRRALPAHRGRR